MSTSEIGDTKVRLVRIMEYTFRDQAAMDDHVAMMDTPLQGTFRPRSGHMVVRSTAMFPSGEHASLFTVQEEDAPRPVSGTILILARSIKTGHEMARRTLTRPVLDPATGGVSGYEQREAGVGYTIRIPGEKLPPGCSVAVIGDCLDGTDEWGAIRSAAYALGLEVLTEAELCARQGVIE